MVGVSSIQVYLGFFLTLQSPLEVIQNRHHFHGSTQSTLWEGVNGRCTLFKMLIMNDASIAFSYGSLKIINIFKVLFWEGGRPGGHK